MKTAILALTLLTSAPAFGADPVATIGVAGCKVINPNPQPLETITWSGGCKDGYADGAGTLEWFTKGKLTEHIEGTLTRGVQNGHGYKRWKDGTEYEGGFLNGQRRGRGIIQLPSKTRYEGEWKDGKRNGKGIEQLQDRTRYEGDWNDGVIEGFGTTTYALGGSYVGQWKAGQFHGRGKATYTSGKVFEGEFIDGLPAGQVAHARVLNPKSHSLSKEPGDMRPTGSIGGSGVSFFASWNEMTKEEQRFVRQQYQMLHEEDEPPYPAGGTARIYRSFSEGQSTLYVTGLLHIDVQIDSSGTATSVTVHSSPSPEMTKVAAFVVMKAKYKPALCAGTPCPMKFPYKVDFSAE